VIESWRWVLLAASVPAFACGSNDSSSLTGGDGGATQADTGSALRNDGGQPHNGGHGRDGGSGRDGSVQPGTDSGGPTGDGGAPGHDSGGVSGDAGTSSDAGGPSGDGSVVGYVPGGQAGPGTVLNGCQIFPSDNAWNVEVDGPNVPITAAYAGLPQGTHLHPDLGQWAPDGGGPYGIPYNVVPASQAVVQTTFGCFADQSDPGPGGWSSGPAAGSICPAYGGGEVGVTKYPFLTGMKIEGDLPTSSGQVGGLPNDAHALVLEQGAGGGSCTVWEAWNCQNTPAPFTCANGAKWDLGSNALRPLGWTSADLAGLSVFAGLLKITELQSGTITHALRVTFNHTQSGYVFPATHATNGGSGAEALGGTDPPMGLRLRMKASVDTSSFTSSGKIVAAGMKKYGLIVADIGSDWYFQGDSDNRWNDSAPDGHGSYISELLGDFDHVTGADFEVVNTGTPESTGL
jgi:hypothetical protein